MQTAHSRSIVTEAAADFGTFTARRAAVAQAVEAFFAREVARLPSEGGLAEAIGYALSGGGKFLRASLCVETARLFGREDDGVIRTAAAIEAVHAYSLAHDDLPCMDDDDMRRGRPSLHRAFDEATAVLVGDALQALAFDWLADAATDSDAACRAELIALLAAAIGARGMVLGQMLDMQAAADNLPALTHLHALKTGRLIGAAVAAGAVLARADKPARDQLADYAARLGLAFQIIDDVLDCAGEADQLGKTLGKDARAGKASFVAALGIDESRAHAAALADEAVALIDALAPDGKGDFLRQAVRFVISRDN